MAISNDYRTEFFKHALSVCKDSVFNYRLIGLAAERFKTLGPSCRLNCTTNATERIGWRIYPLDFDAQVLDELFTALLPQIPHVIEQITRQYPTIYGPFPIGLNAMALRS